MKDVKKKLDLIEKVLSLNGTAADKKKILELVGQPDGDPIFWAGEALSDLIKAVGRSEVMKLVTRHPEAYISVAYTLDL